MEKDEAKGRAAATADNHSAAPDLGALRVTVVVPVRDEGSSIPTLVRSLREQTFPPTEVIIVDGGSTDNTVALTRGLTKDDDRFRVIEAGQATPGRGRNIGIAAARNDWIALTDAGIRVEAEWLEQLARVVKEDSSVKVVYGNVETIIDTAFERYATIAYVAPKRVRAGRLMRAPQIHSSLLCRDVWREVGGFPDLRTSEDLIFMEAVQSRGTKIGWAPLATVWWHLQPTARRTFDRFVLYSRNNVWAGRAYNWQHGTARLYAVALALVALAVLHSGWWLMILGLGLCARIAKSIWRHREGRGLTWLLNPAQFVGVGAIILLVDVATFVGWAQAILWRSPKPTLNRNVVGGVD